MSLDRLKALLAGTAMLVALTACEAGADTAQAVQQDAPATEESQAAAPVLSFEELPEAEREARQALGEEIVRLTAPQEFLTAIGDNIVQGVRLSVPMNYGDISEDEQERIDALAAEYAETYVPTVIPRLGAIYGRLYTEQEMEEIIAFLTSETGEKFRALANEANAGIGEVLQSIVGSVQNEVMREVRPEAFGINGDEATDGEAADETAPDIDLTPDEDSDSGE